MNRSHGPPHESPDPSRPRPSTRNGTSEEDPSRTNVAWTPNGHTPEALSDTHRQAQEPCRWHQPAETDRTGHRSPPGTHAGTPPTTTDHAGHPLFRSQNGTVAKGCLIYPLNRKSPPIVQSIGRPRAAFRLDSSPCPGRTPTRSGTWSDHEGGGSGPVARSWAAASAVRRPCTTTPRPTGRSWGDQAGA